MNTVIRLTIGIILFAFLKFTAFGQNSASGVNLDPPSPGDVGRQFGDSTAGDDRASSENSETGVSGSEPSLLSNELSLGESDMISVDFPNEEIRTVLRNVADLYMLNIVIPEDLQGTTSVKLRDVSWRQIFSVILDPVGYTYVEEGTIIKIVSKDALNFEPPVTEIFMLNYADASGVTGTVSSMVDEELGGRVQIDARTNALIVTERPSKMGNIRQVIERLDKPTLQVLIETRFVEVTDQDVSKIGMKWSSLDELSVSAGELRRRYLHEDVEESYFDADRNYRDQNGHSFESARDPALQEFDSRMTAFDSLRRITNMGDTRRSANAVFNVSEIGFLFSALKEQGNSRLVSHPTVVTLNNQEAEISIGEQYPIPQYQYNEERGTFEISGFDYKDIGVILKVKPSVNNKGLITMVVSPEVSSRTGERQFGGASGATIPIISTRRTQTQVALQDGYTLGLGGLLQASSVDEQSKVPLLHKIPILGKGFRHNDKDSTKLNLLIFITAKILPGEDADFEDVFSQERMTNVGIDMDAIRNQ